MSPRRDVGKAIHPSYVEGQIQGGVAQGIGWALNEEYIYDRQGRLDNAGFLDYRVPVASDVPMIEAIVAINGAIHEAAYFQPIREGCEIFFIPKLEGADGARSGPAARRLCG